MPLPNDPRGQEFIKLLARDQFERGVNHDISSILLEHFQEVADGVARSGLRPGQARRLAQLNARNNMILAKGYDKALDLSAKRLAGYTGVEAEAARVQLASLVEDGAIRSTFQQLTREEIKAITSMPIEGLPLGDWWKKQARDMSTVTRQQIQLGLLAGEGPAAIVGRIIPVEGITGPVAFKRARNNARLLVRTSLTAVQNEAAFQTYKKAPKEVTHSYRYVSARDSRVTPICRALDGQVFGYADKGAKKPPQHIQCRSTIVPEVNYAKLGLKVPDEKGPLGFQSYSDWLKGEPAWKQDMILTKARADLWRQGKATLADMVDADNRLLSLDQLRELITQVDRKKPPIIVPPPKPRPAPVPKPKPVAPQPAPPAPKPPAPVSRAGSGQKLPHEMDVNELKTYLTGPEGPVERLRVEHEGLMAARKKLFDEADRVFARIQVMERQGIASNAELAAMRKEWSDIAANISANTHAQRALGKKRMDAVREAVQFPEEARLQAKVSVEYSEHGPVASIPARWTEEVHEGMEAFRAFVPAKYGDPKRIWGAVYDKDRGFYDTHKYKHIHTGQHVGRENVSTVVHEYAHMLEDRFPELHRKAAAWRDARARGESPQLLSKLTGVRKYTAQEIAYKDKFLSPYIGKIYPFYMNHTEVISMGLQYMHDDAHDFLTRDPDHFWFIVSLFR